MPDRLALTAGADLLASGPLSGQDLPRISAYSLGVFKDCPRKYALRYRQNRYWPAPEGKDQDLESRKRLERGQRFHALVQAHQEGLPTEAVLSAMSAEDEAIAPLWEAFLAHPDSRPEGEVWSEVSLHFFVKDVPVMARFDRIVRHAGRWIILDWKTGGTLESLAESWQTQLYPFALAHAGHVLLGAAGAGGEAIPPEAITLRYWVWKGGQVETHAWDYTPERYAEALNTFEKQAEIVSAPLDNANFPGHLPGSRACSRCQFLTLCHPVPLPEPQAPELPLPRFNIPLAVPPRRGDPGEAGQGVSAGEATAFPGNKEPGSSDTPPATPVPPVEEGTDGESPSFGGLL